MTEQELRMKIYDIMARVLDDTFFPCTRYSIIKHMTDALTTAGIGDVSEWKHRAEVAEDELARHKRALRIAGDKFINEVCNMRGEDISDKCDYKCDTCFYDYYLQQAEKELEEEERKDENN